MVVYQLLCHGASQRLNIEYCDRLMSARESDRAIRASVSVATMTVATSALVSPEPGLLIPAASAAAQELWPPQGHSAGW